MPTALLVDLPAPGASIAGFDFKHSKTRWNGGTDDRVLLDGADVVFINAEYGDHVSRTLHLHEHDTLRSLFEAGGAIVVFVGNCQPFHLHNLVGIPPDPHPLLLEPRSSSDVVAPSCSVETHMPFDDLFAIHGNLIATAHRIDFASPLPDKVLSVQRLLRNSRNESAAVLFRKGAGVCAYLPHFASNTERVAAFVLATVLPTLCPHLVHDPAFKWLEEPPYLMPSLASNRAERARQVEQHEATLKELDAKFQNEWTTTQLRWNRLLTTTGDDQEALEFFAWKVVGRR